MKIAKIVFRQMKRCAVPKALISPAPEHKNRPAVLSVVVRCSAAILLIVACAISSLENAAWSQTSASQVIELRGNTPAEATRFQELGYADPSKKLTMRITLALRNVRQLDELLARQQDRSSPQYQQWLTPEEFSSRFGPSRTDFDALSAWLRSEGFEVTSVSLQERYIGFAGTVAQVERTFATTIMTFGSGTSYSNVRDPLIPSRFTASSARSAGWITCVTSNRWHPSDHT